MKGRKAAQELRGLQEAEGIGRDGLRRRGGGGGGGKFSHSNETAMQKGEGGGGTREGVVGSVESKQFSADINFCFYSVYRIQKNGCAIQLWSCS